MYAVIVTQSLSVPLLRAAARLRELFSLESYSETLHSLVWISNLQNYSMVLKSAGQYFV